MKSGYGRERVRGGGGGWSGKGLSGPPSSKKSLRSRQINFSLSFKLCTEQQHVCLEKVQTGKENLYNRFAVSSTKDILCTSTGMNNLVGIMSTEVYVVP